jgi:hypothetical protein
MFRFLLDIDMEKAVSILVSLAHAYYTQHSATFCTNNAPYDVDSREYRTDLGHSFIGELLLRENSDGTITDFYDERLEVGMTGDDPYLLEEAWAAAGYISKTKYEDDVLETVQALDNILRVDNTACLINVLYAGVKHNSAIDVMEIIERVSDILDEAADTFVSFLQSPYYTLYELEEETY